ncbi:MAG: SIMPL domain-containing protein [Methylacidiphilales bacterium]|nr:SIMPL domain-containing protein [Candidatus Methylacidiphilales bacterium]
MVPVRLLTAFAMSLALTGPLAAQPAPRLVTVLGEARLSAAPDRAFVTAGVTTHGKTAREALAANSRTMAEVMGVLQEAGIAATDIRTTAVSVQPLITYPKDGDRAPRVAGYSVGNHVAMQLTDPAKLGELLDRLVAVGVNQISEVRLGFADEAKRRDAVRTEAVNEARRKAELYAKAAGARLGRVMQLSDDRRRPATATGAGVA